MNHLSRHTEVIAVIPHPKDSKLHIVDAAGEYPSAVHEAGKGTYETTLHALGMKIGRLALSVHELRHDGCAETVVYLTEPPLGEINLNEGYRWQQQDHLP